MKETHGRSIIKTFSWRFVATLTTFIIAWIVFRDAKDAIEKALSVAGVELVAKLLLYYMHERVWNSVKFGSPEKAE